ncbi:MAG: hypothetical protein ACTS2F_30565 [Thainema sp.]
MVESLFRLERIMLIFTDAAKQGVNIVIAVYNDTTGDAIVDVSEVRESRLRSTVYIELRAIALAAERWPNSTIRTDSANARDWVMQDYYPKEYKTIVEAIQSQNCLIEWIPREENIIADWLSHSPISFSALLAPGLSALRIQGFAETSDPRQKQLRREYADQQLMQYLKFLDYASVDELRRAKKWILAWIVRDARIQRRTHQLLEDARNHCSALTAAFNAAKAEVKAIKQMYDELLQNKNTDESV